MVQQPVVQPEVLRTEQGHITQKITSISKYLGGKWQKVKLYPLKKCPSNRSENYCIKWFFFFIWSEEWESETYLATEELKGYDTQNTLNREKEGGNGEKKRKIIINFVR